MLSSGGNPALGTVGGGCVFGLVPFSTSSHSGINTPKEIHLSWKIWRAALLSAAANFPHLPVVLLTTPPTLPRSKAALWRRQEGSGAEQRCAHKAGGGERSILKAHGCSGGLRVAVLKPFCCVFWQEKQPLVRGDAATREQFDVQQQVCAVFLPFPALHPTSRLHIQPSSPNSL